MPDTAVIDRQEPGLDPRFALPERLFFVIGAQKSGTSWTHRYLRSHPEVCTTAWKETNFWPMQQGGRAPSRSMQEGLDKIGFWGPLWPLRRSFFRPKVRRGYAALQKVRPMFEGFRPPHSGYASALFADYEPGHKVAGEVCPSYGSLRPETYARMASLHDDVRFVYLLRDPLDRAIASARHNVKANYGRQGVSQSRTLVEIRNGLQRTDWGILGGSMYDMTFQRLESAVAGNRIRSFFFETYFSQDRIDELTDFLGVARFAAKTDTVVHLGGGHDVEIPRELIEQMAARLAPSYREMQKRFGDALPEAWQISAELAFWSEARQNG